MIVPVTVIDSVVVACLLCVELVWANASGAANTNRTARMLLNICFGFRMLIASLFSLGTPASQSVLGGNVNPNNSKFLGKFYDKNRL